MATPETVVMEALGKAADDTRRALVLRFLRWYGPRIGPGEAPSHWADRCAAFEAAFTAWVASRAHDQIIQWHHMLDYASGNPETTTRASQ